MNKHDWIFLSRVVVVGLVGGIALAIGVSIGSNIYPNPVEHNHTVTHSYHLEDNQEIDSQMWQFLNEALTDVTVEYTPSSDVAAEAVVNQEGDTDLHGPESHSNHQE